MHSLYAITLRAHFTHSFYPLTLYNNATLSFYAPTLRTISTLCETAQRQQSPLPERPLAPRRRRLCLSRLWNFTLRAHVTHSFFALTLSIHFTQLKLRTHFAHSLYALTLRTPSRLQGAAVCDTARQPPLPPPVHSPTPRRCRSCLSRRLTHSFLKHSNHALT